MQLNWLCRQVTIFLFIQHAHTSLSDSSSIWHSTKLTLTSQYTKHNPSSANYLWGRCIYGFHSSKLTLTSQYTKHNPSSTNYLWGWCIYGFACCSCRDKVVTTTTCSHSYSYGYYVFMRKFLKNCRKESSMPVNACESVWTCVNRHTQR